MPGDRSTCVPSQNASGQQRLPKLDSLGENRLFDIWKGFTRTTIEIISKERQEILAKI